MSPLLRFRLAWGGGWELAVGATYLSVLVLLGWCKIGLIGGRFPELDQPWVLFLFLSLPFGFRLRRLVESDGLSLVASHTRWAVRGLCFAILPLLAFANAVALILTGIAPLWAASLGTGLAAVGAWLGFSRGPALIPAIGAAAVLVSCPIMGLFREGWLGDGVAIMLLLAVGFGARMGWRRLAARPVQPCSWSRWLWLERLSDWFDACVMRSPAQVVAPGRLPTMLTAARVGLSGLGGSWLLRLAGLLAMAVGAFAVSSLGVDPMDRLYAVLCITMSISLLVASDWLSGARFGDAAASSLARQVRGLLASERLHPLSRRQAAAATMLTLTGNCLSSVLPLIGGIVFGLVLADAWHGRVQGGLWMMLPLALVVTAGIAAVVLLLLSLPRAIAVMGGSVLASTVLWILLLFAKTGGGGYLSILVIASGLAVLLVPLAWWRLAEMELP